MGARAGGGLAPSVWFPSPLSERTRGKPAPGQACLALLLLLYAGSAWAAVEVRIEGIEGRLLENARAFLDIARDDLDEPDPSQVRRMHERAPAQIRRALEPFGHYRPQITTELTRSNGDWVATYQVDRGPRVQLERVVIDISGPAANDPAFTRAVADTPLTEGAPLAHSDYEDTKVQLMEMAARRGYLDARWTQNVLRVDPDRDAAEAVLRLASGPRYRFGEITFDDTALSEEFLRRYLQFQDGDPYQGDQLLELQYALDDSGYFRRVEVVPQRDRARDGRIPVHVQLAMRPQHRYTFGIGYGTDTGARISVGREDRWVNSSGHTFRTEVQVAEIRNRLSTQYTIPLSEPWRERLELVAAAGEEDIGDGRSRQRQIGARYVTTHDGWQRTLALDLERSTDTISGESTTRDLVMPRLSLVRSRFNDPIYATRGYRISGDLNGGTTTFGSDVSFLRLHLDGYYVRGLWSGGRVLLRGELGRTQIENVDDLPLSQRFFAGGDQSVRGFKYQSLAPRNEEDDVVGGRYLGVASVELEQLVYGNWGVATFVDSGNAMNDLDLDLRTAAGVGVRYRSPVGVLRLDVAKAVDGDEDPRLHLSLGVDF